MVLKEIWKFHQQHIILIPSMGHTAVAAQHTF